MIIMIIIPNSSELLQTLYFNVMIYKFCPSHEFKDSFQNSLNPLCKCSFDVESTLHFLIY